MGTTITLSLPWEAWGTRGVHTRGHSGWVAILGGGARGGGLELEFRLEFDSSDGFEFGVEGLGWKSFMEFLDVYLAGYIKDKDELTDAIKKSMV